MKKRTIVLILTALLIGVAVAYAVNTYVISPTVSVTVEDYSLTLFVNDTTAMKGDTLRFNGTLTSDTYVFESVNVTLWCNSTYTGFSTLTDSLGYYEILFPATTAGTFDFYANATIT